tara:strand:+ start:8782 stop:10641 length:1860 start_codon:yes stop_codon:yes gene_type:complete
MRISKKTIEDIFNVATIEDVISDFVSLKKTGANYKGFSPFNDEKTPSFVVSPSKEIWKDFSSGKGGNLVSFLMEHEQFSYPEALTYLAKKYNITIEYDNIGEYEKNAASERESIVAVLSFVKSQFCENLINDKNNPLNYFLNRGFKNSTIQEFEIGYSLKKRSDIAEKTKKAGYNIKFLKMANVVNENLNCRFSGRVIFPIHSITGQVLGFGGRLTDDKIKAAKYVNSDSSEIYQKSKILYGLHIAKLHIKKLDFCYIVEGYTDVMALHQVGFKNTIANCGTALTKDQIRLIKRFTKNIVILFDSDSAGHAATVKAIDLILEENMTPKILQLPKNNDPASFVLSNSYEKVNKYFSEKTVDFIEFKYSMYDSSDILNLVNCSREILKSVVLIDDRISQSLHIRRLSKLLNLPEDDLISEIKNIKNKSSSFRKKSINSKDNTALDYNSLKIDYSEEFQLIRLIINYGTKNFLIKNGKNFNVVSLICNELEKDNISFSVNIFENLYRESKKIVEKGEHIDRFTFLSGYNNSFSVLASYAFGEQHILSNWKQKDINVNEEVDKIYEITKESIMRFKLKRVRQMVKKSLDELKNDRSDDEKLLKKFTSLSNLEKKIQQELGRLF